ncbi:hypothetical protein WIW89_11350 [Stygiolobus sp. CP850M]|uniref:hypothetical protein n=1 Tax=Stygiolobus sp. CP850M TaxID=3133134 RepID=UPI00307DBC8B
MKNSRMFQLINEAIEEIEKFGSCESAYYILKYLANSRDNLCEEEEVDYDITIDNLIFLAMNGKRTEKKYKLYVNAFFVYDMVSSSLAVQNPLFTFRWGKLYFIYSSRIKSHLNALVKNKFLYLTRSQVRLTQRGEEEMEGVKTLLSKDYLRKINEKLKEIDKMKLKDLKIYTKNYLFTKS